MMLMAILHETLFECRAVYTLSRGDAKTMPKMRPLIMCALLAAAALQSVTAGEPPPRSIAPPERIPDPLVESAVPVGETVPTSTMPQVVRRAVVADAAARFQVDENDVVLTRAEQVTWPDGSLGCPQPGRMYTQMQVSGYRVVAKTAAGELLYHTDARGNAVSCAPLPNAAGKPRRPIGSDVGPISGPPPSSSDR
jgi:hypothetical protein